MNRIFTKSVIVFFLTLTSTLSFAQKNKYLLELNAIDSVFKTPNGHFLFIKRINNHFFIQWKISCSLKTLDYQFDLYGPDAWKPYLIKESDDYLVLRVGCGNPCWVGFFLPLKSNNKLHIINEYLGYDLTFEYVVYLNSNDQLEVLNLKNGKTQIITCGKCDSGFPGYCMEEVYFKKHFIILKWNSHADFVVRKAKHLTFRLKI